MESALDQFKDLPELIYMVVSLLERKDMSAFRLTCRKFRDISNHFFYRDIRLTSCWTRESLQMLAKSARFVCSFESSERACAYYYSSISHTLKDSARLAPSDNATTTPDASSSPTPRQFTNPEQLISLLSRRTLYALCSMNCFPAKLLYAVSLSPRLTTLTLDPIEINTDLDLNVFSRTLSTINNLQSLSLSIYTDHLNAEDVLKALVYNSPSSLESFSLFLEAKEIPVSLVAAVVDHERASLGLKDLDDGNADLSGAEDLDDEDAYLSDTMSALLGPIVERKEPLRRLTDWKLINRYGNIDGDIFISLLEFLPELTSMDVPSIGFQAPVHTFDAATRISKACPKLRNLSKRHIHTDKEGTMALALLHKMPINTVESLQVAWLSEDVRTFGDGLGFHRESVKSIVFDVCRWIAAESLASIFFQSSALEVFRISMNHASVFKIPLEGMVRQQWASNKFTDVKLYLRLPDNHKEAKQPAEPDTTIPNWAVDLERFYRQIGALALLRILDLRVAVPRYSLDRSGALITYKAKTFAGMLTLEDRAAGRLGWLQLLGGLKNLEELHGSFNIGSMVAGFEFSQHEADWIVDHWPRLGFIELYTHHKDAEVEYSLPVQSMVLRLPGLKVARIYPASAFYPWE